jgi:hypothetical protein
MNRSRFTTLLTSAFAAVAGTPAIAEQPPIRIGIVWSFTGGGTGTAQVFDDALALF